MLWEIFWGALHVCRSKIDDVENSFHTRHIFESQPPRGCSWRGYATQEADQELKWKLRTISVWENWVLEFLGSNSWDTRGALCVQMDFMRTFEANTKCNNNKYVWGHFYQILVVLKYHRRLWNNIFDTDIFRCINTHIKGVYLAFFGIFMLLEMSVSKILLHRRLWYFKSTKIW